MKNAIKSVAPGYLLLNKYDLKRKVGAFNVATEDDETAPELGTVVAIGEIPMKDIAKLSQSFTAAEIAQNYCPWKVGMIVGYKKYNHFKFPLGATDQLLVSFDNVLFELEATDE